MLQKQLKGLTFFVSLMAFTFVYAQEKPATKRSQSVEPKMESAASYIPSDLPANFFQHTQEIQAISSNGGAPIPFVVIFNSNTGQQMVTDESGVAIIRRNPNVDTLLLRSIGFIDRMIYPGEPIPSQLRMVEDMISLDQVEVVSQGLVSAEVAALSNSAKTLNVAPVEVTKLEVPQNAAELLWSTGSVMVQQSQQGGGSPILRGFEANRVLLVVDGVRMNNAIYRGGHIHNALTIDPNILERTDVLLGPNSILFGSDAMGGVIHYHTRQPRLGQNRVQTRVSSAFRSPNTSYSVHGDVEWSGNRLASLTSFSYSSYGDLRMGQWRRHGDANWGLDSLYVIRVGDSDEVRINEDPSVQRGSGYQQQDWLQKFKFRLAQGMMDVNFQWSSSSNIPRYDRSWEFSNDEVKWAEWNYGPQQRGMISTRYQKTLPRWDLAWNTMVSYQSLSESRIKRRLHSNSRESQMEAVRVFNAYSTVSKRFYNGLHVTVGANYSDDQVRSDAETKDIVTGAIQPLDTRYPNAGSEMGMAALFINGRWKRQNQELTGGVRWSRSTLDASFDPGIHYTLPFDQVEMRNSALTGGLSHKWSNPMQEWASITSFSTGFRHPNIDDMGKVREKGGYVLVPNDSLRPEYLYSVEQAFHWDFRNEQILMLTLSGFGSKLNDAIVPQLATLNGSDRFFIDGDSAYVQTNVNASSALIGGIRGEVQARLTSNWSIEGAINWTVGDQFVRNPATGVEERMPMSHIPPLFGRVASDIRGRWWTLEIYSLFSGSKLASKFGPFATDNLEFMLDEGAPSWWTVNAEWSAKLHESVECRLGVRNAFDLHYRVFASGISAPGRGVYASLHTAF